MSAAHDIGTLTVAAIRAIGLETAAGVPLASANVVLRKKLELAPKERPPKVLVAVGEQPETELLTAAHKLARWSVAVAVATDGGSVLQDDTRARTWLEALEAELFDAQRTAYAALTGFVRVRAPSTRPFDPGALSKDVVWCVKVFEVHVAVALST